MRSTIFLVSLLFSSQFAYNQAITQQVRGRVTDAQSGYPLPGVHVYISESDPLIGTTTGPDGYYVLDNVPLGRQKLIFTFIGYETRVSSNVQVKSGKQPELNVSLQESVIIAEEIVITATPDKTETNSALTTVSSRSFNLEETGRYAGSRNDPARMAANFAGVSANNDDRNDIVIRGNSPAGLLWRLEGVNIPNPNHFGSLSSTGGPVSIINYNNLDKSDFLTGAFPAEYGNALAGVFDLQLRSGNREEHEFLGQIGFNGFEAGAEGPVRLGNTTGSYLANYRYSTLGLFQQLGVDFGTGSATPNFQDLTFKIELPTANLGRFSVFGIGGISAIDLLGSETTELDGGDLFGDENLDQYLNYRTGIFGLTHTYYFNKDTYSRLSVAATQSRELFTADSVDVSNRANIIPLETAELTNNRYSSHLNLTRKFGPRHTIKGGIITDVYDFELYNERIVPGSSSLLRDANDQTVLLQYYLQWQYRIGNALTLNSGLNYMVLSLNNTRSLQPRIGLEYELKDQSNIAFAYGLHSQIQPLLVYFNRTTLANGTSVLSNKHLEFSNSQHFVASYQRNFGSALSFKLETYYQQINNVPVETNPSSFSLLNAGAGFEPVDETFLVNEGNGRNIGAEITLEKYFTDSYYFLFTTSVFDSKYEGSDGVERNTAFNGGYIVNLLGGKEFSVGNRGHKLAFDVKLTASGGNRFTPIDLEASGDAGFEVTQDEQAFSEQLADYFRADVKVSYRINQPNITHEFSLDVQNITNRQNVFVRRYNPRTNTINTQYQIGLFPIPQYRILF